MDFQNPYVAPFLRNDPSPQTSKRAQSLPSDGCLVFKNDFQNRLNSTSSDGSEFYQAQFDSEFSRNLRDDGYMINTKSAGSKVIQTDDEPLTFVIRRHGLTNTTQLCDPLNDEVIYSINQHHPGLMSQRPNLEILRTISGDALVGTVRYNSFSTQMTSTATGQTYNDIDNFKSYTLREQKPGSKLVWKIKPSKSRPKTYLGDDGGAHIRVTEPLVKLELIDDKHKLDQPFCVVSMYTVRPIGTIEVYARSACVNHDGGDWAPLDEIILSAYANMERVRKRLMRSGQAVGPSSCGYLCQVAFEFTVFFMPPIILYSVFYFWNPNTGGVVPNAPRLIVPG